MPTSDALNGSAPAPLELSRDVARRYLALHHLLAPPRSLPAEPASVMAVFDRLGSIQFDPIDVAGRNHDLVLLARIAGYRREWTDALLYEERRLFEAYNKRLSIVPTAELPWYRISWDRERTRHEGGTFDEHAELVEELLGADPDRGAAVVARRRPARGDRLVLAADEPGPGDPRGARRGRHARASPGATATSACTTWSSGCSRRSSSRSGIRRANSSATSCCRATAATGCWAPRARTSSSPGRTSQRELGVEDGLPMGTATRKLALNDLVEAGTLLPVEIDGVKGLRFIVAGEAALLRQAQAEVAAGTPPGGTRPRRRVPRRRSTRSSGTGRSCGRSTTSTTSGRSTSRPRSGAGATTSCRCSTATGSSAGSSCGWIARPGCCGILGVWWEDGFDPLADEAFAVAFAEALEAHRAFAGSKRWRGRGPPGCGRWSTRSSGHDRQGTSSRGRAFRPEAGQPSGQRPVETTPSGRGSVVRTVDQAPQLPALSRPAVRNS